MHVNYDIQDGVIAARDTHKNITHTANINAVELYSLHLQESLRWVPRVKSTRHITPLAL